MLRSFPSAAKTFNDTHVSEEGLCSYYERDNSPLFFCIVNVLLEDLLFPFVTLFYSFCFAYCMIEGLIAQPQAVNDSH